MKSIKTKMMVYFSIAILLITMTLTTIAYFSFRNLMVNEMKQSLFLMTQESADLVGKILESNLTPLLHLAKSEAFYKLNVDEQVLVIGEINLSFYEGLAVVDKNGMAYYTDGTVLDLSDREYIKNVLGGETNYSDLIISRKLNKPVIMGAIPVMGENGAIGGAIIARVRIEEMNELISQRGYGENGFAYIIDGSGSFIYNGNEQSFYEGVTVSEMSHNQNEEDTFSRFFERSKKNERGIDRYSHDGQTIWMGYNCIDTTKWKIYIGAEEKDIFSSLERLRQTFVILNILIFALTMPTTKILTRKLTLPILKLDKAFVDAMNGDLSVRVNLDTNDEIERAGNNFNQMMDYVNTLTYDDPITLLPNLLVFEKELKQESLNYKEAEDKSHTLFLLTVNGFDRINENFGYSFGNDILRKIAKSLKERAGINGRVYKGRAEDFFILCERMSYKHAIFLANVLIKEIEKIKRDSLEKVTLDVSVGIDFIEQNHSKSLEELLALVTHARNIAKENGANKVVVYDALSHQKKKELQSLEEDLIDAIERKAFHLVYQPQYDIESGRLTGAEALIRWSNLSKGNISPDVFIHLAEKNEVVHHIDYWVIEQALSDFRLMEQSFLMSINITSQSFDREDFIEKIEKMVGKYGIHKGKIQFELTERALVRDIPKTIKRITKLKELGIKVAIDDFGVGYSSLNYILQLPVDCIKIDRSFIKGITDHSNAKAIVATIMTMSRALGLKTVAEGVESAEVLSELKALKCDFGQGYYFNKPMRSDELIQLVSE